MAMRSLTDDMDHYHRAFGVYHRVADRYNVLSQWVNTELRQAFKSMNVNYTDGKEDMKILSIGPGDGRLGLHYSDHFARQVNPKHCLPVDLIRPTHVKR